MLAVDRTQDARSHAPEIRDVLAITLTINIMIDHNPPFGPLILTREPAGVRGRDLAGVSGTW